MTYYAGILVCVIFAVLLLGFAILYCVYESRFEKEYTYIQDWLKTRGYMLKKSDYGELDHWALMRVGEFRSPVKGYVSGKMYYEIIRIRRLSDETVIKDRLEHLSIESNREVKRSKIWEN